MQSESERAATRYTQNPYPTWEPGQGYQAAIESGSLVDIPAVHAWFSRMDQARRAGLYTYAAPAFADCGSNGKYLDQEMISFSNYHYLSLGQHPALVEAGRLALERYGAGVGGARPLTGTIDLHLEAEAELAKWLGREDCVLFHSGYDANLAAIPSLFGPRDAIIIDQYAHRSLYEAAGLSRAKVHKFRHNNLEHVRELVTKARDREQRVLIVVDGVYSMGGDLAPLVELVALKKELGAYLLVDDAHGTGTLGPLGEGTVHALGIDPAEIDITTTSLAKALPAGGGAVLGSKELVTYLRLGSAPAMFSVATSPVTTAVTLAAAKVVQTEPEHRERMWANTRWLCQMIERLGFGHIQAQSPVVPLMLNDSVRSLLWARHCLDSSIYVSAVPAPAVPEGQERLRLCGTASYTAEQLERLETVLSDCLELERDIPRLERTLARYASRDEEVDLRDRQQTAGATKPPIRDTN